MNFLGHSYFKGQSDLFLIGNICGDFFKGNPQYMKLPKELIDGIIFHRTLDQITDSSKAFKDGKDKLIDFFPYSGVILDIYYDHFFAKNWDILSSITLAEHSHTTYTLLNSKLEYIPDNYIKAIRRMNEEDWFTSYKNIDFIELTLKRLSSRTYKKIDLSSSISLLINQYNFFENNFFDLLNEVSKSLSININKK